MHILPNISRSKGNQTMKLSPLKIITQETFFLKNHTQNIVEKLFPDPFSSISKLGISLGQ